MELGSLLVLLIVLVVVYLIGHLVIGLLPDPTARHVAYVLLAVILLAILLRWLMGGHVILTIAPALRSGPLGGL